MLSRIGKAHGKTAAQVCLRYLVQQDIVVIPKTSRAERLTENAAIFDFQLTPAEMKEIAALASPQRQYRQLDTGDGRSQPPRLSGSIIALALIEAQVRGCLSCRNTASCDRVSAAWEVASSNR